MVEAVQSGAKCLLIDEDTCATNFMVRDELMQAVVSGEQEPITPFTLQAGNLYQSREFLLFWWPEVLDLIFTLLIMCCRWIITERTISQKK